MDKLPEINRTAEGSLTTALIDCLREHILKNYQADQKFPSERQLAEYYNVSRITTGKVIKALVQESLLYQLKGSGTYAAEKKSVIHNKIGLIVYHSDNPFYSKVIKIIQTELDKSGFHAILVNTEGNPEKENQCIRNLKDGVDGFIIAPVLENNNSICQEIQNLINQNFPTVLICHIPGMDKVSNVSTVIPDSFQGGYSITQYLIEKGYRKILFVSVEDIFQRQDIIARYEGYREALKKYKIQFKEEMFISTSGSDPLNGYFNDGYKLAEKIIPMIEPHTAIFAIGDSSAIGLMRGLKEKNISIPEDVGICGFDDIELSAQWGIELTTVRVDFESLAGEAAKLIISRIGQPGQANIEHIVCPAEPVIRKSC